MWRQQGWRDQAQPSFVRAYLHIATKAWGLGACHIWHLCHAVDMSPPTHTLLRHLACCHPRFGRVAFSTPGRLLKQLEADVLAAGEARAQA